MENSILGRIALFLCLLGLWQAQPAHAQVSLSKCVGWALQSDDSLREQFIAVRYKNRPDETIALFQFLMARKLGVSSSNDLAGKTLTFVSLDGTHSVTGVLQKIEEGSHAISILSDGRSQELILALYDPSLTRMGAEPLSGTEAFIGLNQTIRKAKIEDFTVKNFNDFETLKIKLQEMQTATEKRRSQLPRESRAFEETAEDSKKIQEAWGAMDSAKTTYIASWLREKKLGDKVIFTSLSGNDYAVRLTEGPTVMSHLEVELLDASTGKAILENGKPKITLMKLDRMKSVRSFKKPNAILSLVSEVDKDAALKMLIGQRGWTKKTKFYRIMPRRYLKEIGRGKVLIPGNPQSVAEIRDIYSAGTPKMDAGRLGVPSLNAVDRPFPPGVESNGDRVIVEFELGDVLEAGGLPYPDTGAHFGSGSAFILTVPHGKSIPGKIVK